MAIEHKNIADPNIHEPKGASTAVNKTVYISDGAGSGSWSKITKSSLNSEAATQGQILEADGVGGFTYISPYTYGAMTITNNATNLALTAVADTTFNTASQFTLVTGTGAPWVSENLSGVTFNTDKLTAPITGVYIIDTYLNIGAFPASSAKVAIRYRINGSDFSSRKPTVKSSGVGAEGQLIGFGLVALSANDYIQLYVATDNTGNLLIRDANVILRLVKQTA